ncbi:MAG TPA: PKD domain-containing protein, partial [Saprospiraceae bacterium]|nr:PKD domain-containing protein [Saprospiraceae bacterium]
NNIISNNHVLSANGGSVSAVANGDGAGGGGGGGTILLQANSVSGMLRLQANGGNGGNVNNGGQARCHGPGGGGSGGRVLAPENPMLFINNDGGTAGTSSNSATCANGNNGALPGEAGIRAPANAIPQSTQQNEPPIIVAQPRTLQPCPNMMLIIPVVAQGANLNFQWQINTGAGFQNIQNNAIYNGVQTPELQISNTSAVPVDAQFRLRASNNCAETVFTDLITLALQPTPVAQFDFIVTGNTVQFVNRSVAADTYRWDFDDGNDTNAADPTHTYNNAGAFTVTLTAFGACDTVSFSQVVTIVAAPLADFTANVVTGCAPLSVVFENLSSPDAVSFAWILPGATPAFSTARNPTVVYNAAGSYSVTLIASNAIGLDTLMRIAFITVRAAPTAGFWASADGLAVTFLNTSSADADSYLWVFGDGSTSSEEHPTHTYMIPGIYIVTLTVTNACGSRSFTLEIAAGTAPLASFFQKRYNSCPPHFVTF